MHKRIREQAQHRLNHLADVFEQQIVDVKGTTDGPMSGWGQFLDAPRQNTQCGPYGTSSGVIVLASAGRTDSTLMNRVRPLMTKWWDTRVSDPYAQERFLQNPRLAFFFLALRLAGRPVFSRVYDECLQECLHRRIAGGIWGNYWLNTDKNDPTPRAFASAIMILAFALSESGHIDRNIVGAADEIEKRLVGLRALEPSGQSLMETAALAAALLTVKRSDVSKQALRYLSEIAAAGPPRILEKSVYFYNYERPIANKGYRHGYFLVPSELLLTIAGLQPAAPPALCLRAERALDQLSAHLAENDGMYRTTEGRMAATVDQAWVSILFALLKKDDTRNVWSGMRARMSYALRCEREGNVVTRIILPLIALLTVASASVFLESGVPKLISALGAIVVGTLYGPDVVRRLVQWQP